MNKKQPQIAILAILAALVPPFSGNYQPANAQPPGTAYAGAVSLNDDARTLHLLNRITFGPTENDIQLVQRIGIDNYIDSQLNPQSIEESPQVVQMVQSTEALSASPLELIGKYSRQILMRQAKLDGLTDKKEIQKQINGTYKDIHDRTLTARLKRDVETPRQLEAVMTDFWFNHFNISINKGPMDRFLVGSFEQQAIRPNALGKFRDLLEATAHHPAMLFYLDNWQNTAPNSNGGRGKLKGINENYARELMELHTLGVDGGYGQQDVVALAHILTGLGLPPARQFLTGNLQTDQFGAYFDRSRHDFGSKTFLGVTIEGQGKAEIEHALDMLSMHPATAHHISYQLAQYFVCDDPPATLVDKLSRTYLRSGGDIKAVISTLLHSSEFWSADNNNAKYKSPYRYAVSVLRASGTQLDNVNRVAAFLRSEGEPLYGCLTPDGYKNTKDAWLNSDGLLKRIAFAGSVVKGAVGEPPEDIADRVAASAGNLSERTEKALSEAAKADRLALILGSPEFQTY